MKKVISLLWGRSAKVSNGEPSTARHTENLQVFNTQRLFRIMGKNQSEEDIIDEIDACLKNGADVNAQNDAGYTVLHIAEQKSYQSVVEFLLGQNGAKRDIEACSSLAALSPAGPDHQAAGAADNAVAISGYIPHTHDTTAMSNDTYENSDTRNPIDLNYDVDECFTELIIDEDLKFGCENYINSLKSIAKDSNDINHKLNVDPYPSDHTLALLALKAYSDNPDDETHQKLPEGWELLTTGSNAGWSSGYFGAAFWCRALQQVVVAHRGTTVTDPGAMWTNMKSIIWNKETLRVCSAVTFTEAIATALNEAKEEGVSFQLSITGHSLGGWLAQVTAFTVKYLQRDESTFRKITNIKDGYHAHTVVFESPGCRTAVSKMKDKFDLRYERSIFLRRLDISSYLSAPNRINSLNMHLGVIYRVMTNLSDVTALDEYTTGYTLKTHSMEKMAEALETPNVVQILDWPLRSVLWGEEYNKFFKSADSENKFHQQTDRYEFKDIDRKCCSLRIFSEDELLLLDSWMILKKSKMNLTNLIEIKGLVVSHLFDEFMIDKQKQIMTCLSEDSIKRVIRHTKALMRWVPSEVMSAVRDQAALVPSAAEAVFRAAGDSYLRSLERSRVDFRDAVELEAFLTSGSNILNIRTPDGDMEMVKLANIFRQIKKKWEKNRMYTKDYHYSFMNLKEIKRLESVVNIEELFKYCFKENYLFFIQYIEKYNFETILIKILANLEDNPNSKLVLVTSHDTGFQDLAMSIHFPPAIGNNLVSKYSGKITLNDLTEESVETLFEEKIFLLRGERLSLQTFVGKYRDLTADQLNNVNTLIGSQMLKKILTIDNYIIKIEDAPLNPDDLKVHSTLNMEVSPARVARTLRIHSRDALVVISGIGREELGTDRWMEFASCMGDDSEERIFTTIGDGECVFKQMCRTTPNSTVYWLAASAEYISCKTIYEKEFYMKRRYHKIIFDFQQFICDVSAQNAILVLLIFENKQSLIDQFLNAEHIKTAATDKEVDDIIKENSDKPVHVLKQDAGQILWHRSRGSLDSLRPYVIADISEPIDEEELCSTSQKVVIIADEPGMGKSTSLTSVSRLLRSAWVIRVDLKDFQNPIQNLPPELTLNSICEFILGGKDRCLRGLLRFCLDKQNENSRLIYLLFDGFDEIKQNSFATKICAEDEVLRLLKYLNENTAARIWVTTRLHRKEMLEDALSAFAVRFERISESQQREYLVKFWRAHLILQLHKYGEAEERKLNKCAEYLNTNTKKVLGDDVQNFMGIPLQMRMLAEVFMERVKEYIESEADIGNIFNVKSVFDLYQQFITLKYEIYFNDKTGLSAGLSREMKHSNIELITEKHRLLGLGTLFPEFAKTYFDNPEDGWRVELCRIGLVQSGGNGRDNIEFIHRTLAEYFCADLAVDWLRRKGQYHGHATMEELLLTEILLQDSHKVIRLFINNLIFSQPLSEDVDKSVALKISELWCDKQSSLFNQDLNTALHVAVQEKNIEILDSLVGGLKSKVYPLIAFIAARNRDGDTALCLAAREADDSKIMQKIIQSIDTCPYEIILELLLATYIRYRYLLEDEIKLLSDYLEGEAPCSAMKKAFIRTKTIMQEDIPPFLAAVEADKAEDVAEVYRKMKNDTERRYMLLAHDDRGETALHYAARDSYYKIPTQLIKMLCNHDIPEVGRSYNNHGQTPLHCAAEAGHLDTLEHLISHGVYINSLSMSGETVLFFAARVGRIQVLEYLLENEADINIVNKNGTTVVFHEASKGNLEVVKTLIEKIGNINILDKNGENVLFSAARSESLPMVEYLVKKKGDINILNNNGETVLFSAVCSENLPVIKYLVNKGVDINISDRNGENVLFNAVRTALSSKKLLVMEYLVKEGININILNKDGENVLFVTARTDRYTGRFQVLKFLLEKGVNFRVLNKYGHSVLDYATRKQNRPFVELLEKLSAQTGCAEANQ